MASHREGLVDKRSQCGFAHGVDQPGTNLAGWTPPVPARREEAGMVEEFERRLAKGEVIVIDGGTGTELEARGVPMNGAVWCGVAWRCSIIRTRSVACTRITSAPGLRPSP